MDADLHDATVLVTIPLRVLAGRADATSVAEALGEVVERFEGALLARGVSVGTIGVSVLPVRADRLAAAVGKVAEGLA